MMKDFELNKLNKQFSSEIIEEKVIKNISKYK